MKSITKGKFFRIYKDIDNAICSRYSNERLSYAVALKGLFIYIGIDINKQEPIYYRYDIEDFIQSKYYNEINNKVFKLELLETVLKECQEDNHGLINDNLPFYINEYFKGKGSL